MRTAEIKRKTAETDIVLKLNADGSGKSDINTGLDFLITCCLCFHAMEDLISNWFAEAT